MAAVYTNRSVWIRRPVMTILEELSSQIGDRSEESNRHAARQILDNPSLLTDIASGLQSGDAALIGDCAEVMTMVSETHPEWITPYFKYLGGLLTHKKPRVRWESMHALANLAPVSPGSIQPLLPVIRQIINDDKSIIARDYAVIALSGYAKTSPQAAMEVYPLLKEAMHVFEGRHAHHAMRGIEFMAIFHPDKIEEILILIQPFEDHKRGVIRKTAKKLIQALQNEE